jgi:hypothetical protein
MWCIEIDEIEELAFVGTTCKAHGEAGGAASATMLCTVAVHDDFTT